MMLLMADSGQYETFGLEVSYGPLNTILATQDIISKMSDRTNVQWWYSSVSKKFKQYDICMNIML